MLCPKCSAENSPDEARCTACGANLAVAVLEVIRGDLPEKIRFLRPRSYSIGRARHNDIALNESSISKHHARLEYQDGRFFLEDADSLHGLYVNATKIRRAELTPGAQIQLGNLTLKYSVLGVESSTGKMGKLPWVEQQQLLLSLVQTLNSTLVLSQVLEQVLDAIMHITGAERGFLLLADASPDASRFPTVAGLRLRVARGRTGNMPPGDGYGVSAAVVRRALESGEIISSPVSPVEAPADADEGAPTPSGGLAISTLCLPLRSPRAEVDGTGAFPRGLGALYVDNARSEELQRAQAQLLQSEKLATIGQMAAGIAHELNTPLTYIMGNLELLGVQEITPAQREMLTAITQGADRIRTLAQRLLAFSRPGHEEMVPLAPNDVIERSLELCQYQITGGRVQLVKDLAPDLPRVTGVSNQLEMALINLVINAVHSMAENGGTLRVTSARRGTEVAITVSDEGIGIPEAIRGRLFEPFVTTKPEGLGTGLGLSTVLMILERHQGQIDFTTEEGRGTVFVVRLPGITEG